MHPRRPTGGRGHAVEPLTASTGRLDRSSYVGYINISTPTRNNNEFQKVGESDRGDLITTHVVQVSINHHYHDRPLFELKGVNATGSSLRPAPVTVEVPGNSKQIISHAHGSGPLAGLTKGNDFCSLYIHICCK